VAVRLQFSRQPNLLSSVIAWESGAPLSHVDAILPGGMLLGARSNVIGGKPAGVQIRPPDYAKFALRVVFNVPATDAQESAFYNFLHSQIGKPYDNLAILGFATGRDWRNDGAWICSELIARAGELSTILRFLYIEANKINPGTCAAVYSAIGSKWECFGS
jgi:hypothetical protein